MLLLEFINFYRLSDILIHINKLLKKNYIWSFKNTLYQDRVQVKLRWVTYEEIFYTHIFGLVQKIDTIIYSRGRQILYTSGRIRIGLRISEA